MNSDTPATDTLALDPDRIRAKQLEMLQIDIDHSLAWVETMRKLVDRSLDDRDFTINRMAALKEWERSRKSAQKRLHYKYDPVKRKPRLVTRDVERTLAWARGELATHEERLRERAAELAPKLEKLAGQLAPRSEVRQRPPAPARVAALHAGFAKLAPATLQMIKDDLGDLDIETATDEEILDAYAYKGVPIDAAQFYLGLINGTN